MGASLNLSVNFSSPIFWRGIYSSPQNPLKHTQNNKCIKSLPRNVPPPPQNTTQSLEFTLINCRIFFFLQVIIADYMDLLKSQSPPYAWTMFQDESKESFARSCPRLFLEPRESPKSLVRQPRADEQCQLNRAS